MRDSYTYLIVGAGTAGHFAAESIRKHDPDGCIAIIGNEPHRPYHRPPLSKGVLTGKVNPMAVYLKKSDFYERNQIDVFTDVLAESLDVDKKTVVLTDGRKIGYSKLLLATGGKARSVDLPGNELGGVYTLRTLEDSQAILRAGEKSKHACIVGAGFISAEVATSLWHSNVPCTILMRGEYLLQRVLPRELSVHLHKEAEEFGINIISCDSPTAFKGNAKLQKVITSNGKEIDCDLAVIGIGLELNVGIAREAGINVAKDEGILTDAYMRTSEKDVWAAGDICSYEDKSFARRMRVERTENAKGQGIVAGADMAGADVEPFSKIPIYTFHIFDLSIKVFGAFDTCDLLRVGTLEGRSAAYYSFRNDALEGYLGFNRPYKESKLVKQQIYDKASKEEIIRSLEELGENPVAVIPE